MQQSVPYSQPPPAVSNAPFLQGPSSGATAGGAGQWAPPPTPPPQGPKVNPFLPKAEDANQRGLQTSAPANQQRPASASSQGPGTQGGYNDASSAAAAAREYYLQAKLASEAAERWAQGPPSQAAYPGAGQSSSGQAGAPPGPSMRPPSLPFPGDAQDAAGASSSLGQPPPPVKFARSTSDIQRAYDAAPGPPTKGVVQDTGPPSAPPAPPVDRTTSVLPSPPTEPNGSSARDGSPQPPSPSSRSKKPTNELDDLTLRFEALKKR